MVKQFTGSSAVKWLNVESPKVSNRRVDLLCRLKDGRLVHIELQSRNERHFGFRMGQYLFEIARRYGSPPVQIVLYVGEAPLRMKNRVEGPGVSVEYLMVDIRDMDGERLLARGKHRR